MTGTLERTIVRGPDGTTTFGGHVFEPAQIRLMVVDAHPLVRWALTQIAADQPDLVNVGEAADAADAVTFAFAATPDVITIDCALPDGAAWQLARSLRDKYEDMGIVMLGEASDETLLKALDSGASAFVSKAAPIREVVSAIRHAAASASGFSAAGLSAALRRRREASERMALSPREHQILLLLHDGLSVPEIAAQLFVSLSTAKTYVARLYDKLGARNRAQALMTAVRLGMFEAHQSTAVAV